jgi:hypothetical protein
MIVDISGKQFDLSGMYVMRGDKKFTALQLIRSKHRIVKPFGYLPGDVLTPEYEQALSVFWGADPIIEWCRRCFVAWITRRNHRERCPLCHSKKWQYGVTEEDKKMAGRPRTVAR